MSDTQSLQSLGSKTTQYLTDKPRSELLETFENQHQDLIYLVPFVQERDEFTSLCPRTGQPDHAKIEIVYVPNIKMVESKSLKLYLFSFRNTGEFHEDVINRITKDLFNLLQPKYLRVYGDFAPRGGLAIKPLVEKWNKINRKTESKIKYLVTSFDTKK
jgi:7-cyano-7-deazaguanine reductase